MSLFALKGSSGDNSSHPSMEYGQFPFLSTSVSQDNLFQERSHSQSKWNLWWSVITTPFKVYYCYYYYYYYCISYYYNGSFSEKFIVQYLYMVKFVSSKEMLQITEEIVQKGTYKTVCHGTVLMWFVIWHNKESRGHNMETNQLQITTMLQFHITFTLASIMLCSRAVAVVSQ